MGILYAGADHPPPRGFLWVIPFDAVAAWIVYRKVPIYIEWSREKKRHRVFRALLEGLAAGLVFAFVARLIPGTGEPSRPPPGWGDIMIWFGVVGTLGSANAFGIYFLSALMARR